jgi:hypothetical protein
MAFPRHSDFTPSDLFDLMVGLIACNDADLVDNLRCFPCPAESHSFWQQARDLIVTLRSAFDYTHSPEFSALIAGKREQFTKVARNLAAQKKVDHKRAFDEAIREALTSDRIFELAPTSEHDELRKMLQTVKSMAKSK